MTTDRPAAPTRGTALADRVAAGGRTQAPPTDAFSALLGAVAPKSDAPARRDERPVHRDDTPRWDDGPRHVERRPQQPKHDEYRRPDTDAKDVPATEGIDTSCEPEAPADVPATPTTPSLFALQLASPLPPATPAATTAPATTAAPAEGAPVLPVLPSIVPASVVAATATAPLAGEVAAATAAEQPAVPPAAVAASAVATALTGLPADAQAAEGEFTLPENLLKPQTPGAAQTTPGAQAPQAQGTAANADQSQTGADSQNSGQPNTPASAPAPTAAPTPTAAAAAAAAQPKAEAPAEVAPSAQPVAPTPTSAPVATTANGRPNVERAVPLSRAVATTGVLIHLASERGVTHARLNLKPVELGGIEVKLHSTPAGIHAQLVADSPEAARMLAQAGDDLRRQLEARDVNLLSLDVSTSSDQRNDQPGFNADGFGDDYRPGGYPSSFRGSREDTVLMETPAAADTVLVLPDGVHVDVLA